MKGHVRYDADMANERNIFWKNDFRLMPISLPYDIQSNQEFAWTNIWPLSLK